MNQFEIDVARMTFYKLSGYNAYGMEKDAGIGEVMQKYTPTFYSIGKKYLKKPLEKYTPTLWPMTHKYLDEVTDKLIDLSRVSSDVIKTKPFLPSTKIDLFKSIISPVSGWATGLATSPFVNIPLASAGNKVRQLSERIPGESTNVLMPKLKSAAEGLARGIDIARNPNIHATIPNNILGLAPYALGFGAGAIIPVEAYAAPALPLAAALL